jgi:hypothetical protein
MRVWFDRTPPIETSVSAPEAIASGAADHGGDFFGAAKGFVQRQLLQAADPPCQSESPG